MDTLQQVISILFVLFVDLSLVFFIILFRYIFYLHAAQFLQPGLPVTHVVVNTIDKTAQF